MQVAVERLPGSKVEMTVTVEPAVVEERMEQLFQKYARRVAIPGFRPGKAPRSLIESRIDRSALLQDAIEDTLNSSYRKALEEQGLEPMSEPQVSDINPGADMSLTYKVTMTIRPEVSLPAYDELVVAYEATKVTDEQVDAELERLREHFVDYTNVADEPIQTGDYVTIDYDMKLDGAEYPEGNTSGYPLEVGADTLFPELNEALLGLKEGETKVVSISYPEDYSSKDLAGKTAEFDVVVKEVRRRTVPELSDALASMATNGEIQTVDELRKVIQTNLERMATQMDRDQIREDLMRQLIEKTNIEIPDELAEARFEEIMEDFEHRLSHDRKTIESYAEQAGRTVADIENEQRVLARESIRRTLVMQEIARQENIVIADADLDAMALISAASRGEAPVDKIQRNVKRYRRELEESGEMDRLANSLFREKIYQFLETHANVTVDGQPLKPASAEEQVEEAIAEAEVESEE